MELLLGFDRDGSVTTWSGQSRRVKFCQVYDAPDPGEGWRLVDVEKEKGEVGDEFLTQSGVWLLEWRHNGFEDGVPYRRRIKPPKPKYVPFTWEDRDQLRGRWYTITLSCGKIREYQIEFLRLSRNVLYIGSFTSAELLEKNARFLDTGEPVGRKVME